MSPVTDPIADFLARVRNGTRAQKTELFIPYSKMKAEIPLLRFERSVTAIATQVSA